MSTPNNNKASKKRTRGNDDDDDDDDDEVIIVDDGTPPPAPRPDELSPPGTKLRSGRKVPPSRNLEERMQRAKKRAKLGKEPKEIDTDEEQEGGGVEDEEMKEASAEANEAGDRKMAASVTGGSTAAESAAKKSKPETVDSPPAAAKIPPARANLRLPSQHTPGRIATATAARPTLAAAARPESTAVRINWSDNNKGVDNEMEAPPAPRQRMNLVKTPHKPADATTTAVDIVSPPADVRQGLFQNETSPSQQPPPPPPPVEQEFPFELPPWLDHALSQPLACFIVLGLLMLPNLFIVNPFLDSAVNASRKLVPFYQSIVGRPKPVAIPENDPVKMDIVEKKVLSEETKQLMADSQKLNQTLLELQEQRTTVWSEIDQARRTLEEQSAAVESQMETLEARQTVIQGKLGTTLATLQERTYDLQRIAKLSSQVLVPGTEVDEEGFFALRESLPESVAHTLLQLWDLPLWEPELETCEFPELEEFVVEESEEDDERPAAVTRELVKEYWEELKEELEEEFDAIEVNEDWKRDIMRWIQDYADATPLPQYEIPKIPVHRITVGSATGTGSKRGRGPSAETIRKIVNGRLEVDRADGTGRIDYAAIYAGAAVVPAATSPSLADSLPLLNRLMAVMGLQFYGYGPDAALTPSYPAGSLGQCWAFVEEEPVNKFGGYAVLTVRLAKSIKVQSISIEHPPPDGSKRTLSAIRKFRVLGFVDPEAASEPISLGSFTFEMNNKKRKLREEYEVDGSGKVASISLVIDSTWGQDYACLYRLRVHGRE
eukprot:scaffold16630_cov177-Amphora_coffeaeformis.AAC.11